VEGIIKRTVVQAGTETLSKKITKTKSVKVIEHQPSKWEALSSNFNTAKKKKKKVTCVYIGK
jgi:hypothetical protein